MQAGGQEFESLILHKEDLQRCGSFFCMRGILIFVGYNNTTGMKKFLLAISLFAAAAGAVLTPALLLWCEKECRNVLVFSLFEIYSYPRLR